ncbi:MAG TPA: hypothetical protein VFI96_04015 [Longimicrobiaceae bacterium]|nr:hypothetical protein [Longimicrobiaceae bacterium]
MRTRTFLSGTLLALLTACGPGIYRATPGRDASVITRPEIEQSPAPNAFLIVQRLRPQWLHRARPHTIREGDEEVMVFLGAARLGGLDELRNLSTLSIQKIEYLSAAAAQQRFGAGLLNGAIVVTPAER